MNKRAVVSLIWCVFCEPVWAQLDLLTLREAEAIVEKIPEIATARLKGQCPQLSATYSGAVELSIQARVGCGPTGGMLINNYTVDRRTGTVATWGDNPKPVLNPDGELLARQLVQQARARILSLDESRCLALRAAKSLPGWSDNGSVVSVRPFGRNGRIEVQFTAEQRSTAHAEETGRLLTINRSTVQVRDDETGMNLMSAGVGELIAKLMVLRTPPWLTDEDAVLIALQVPAVAARVPDKCRLYAGGAFNSDEVEAGATCDGRPVGGAITINLRTGEVRDAESQKTMASPKSEQLTHQILDDESKRRSELLKEVEAVCAPE